jgi:hypothetical protein
MEKANGRDGGASMIRRIAKELTLLDYALMSWVPLAWMLPS